MGEYQPDQFLDEVLRGVLLRGLTSAFPDYVACIDRQRRVLFVNRTITRDISEVLGKLVEDFVAPTDRATVVLAIERAFDTNEPQLVQFDVAAPTGETRHLKANILPSSDSSGRSAALLIVRDETERLRMRAELERSEEFRRRVIENLPDYVSLVDREHRFIWVNRLAPSLELTSVIGTRIEEFLAPESIEPTATAIDTTFATGVAGQCETRGYHDAIATRWVLNRTVPIELNGAVDSVLLITSDLSELKRAEQALREKEKQLQHAQHLESIGQLAGGIAHDFNNLLQVIGGNLYFAREGLAHGQDISEELDQAQRAMRGAADLTSRLLAVARRKRVAPTRVDLGSLTSAHVPVLRAVIPANIDITFTAPAEAYFVDVDVPEFQQVLLNLCNHGRDTMPNGGTLQLRIEPEGTDHVVLSVADDGVGVPKHELPRVFEPFFGAPEGGAGLGLAVAAGIVAAHGGTIQADSDGVRGTTMRVRLPRAGSAPESARPAPERAAGGRATILVAEDEALVRAQVVRILEGAGYRVLAAENGLRAIELFQAAPGDIDLLVLDAIMPHCDGWRAYLEIERTKPGIKALFTTGYAANVLPSDFGSRGARLLGKPFKAADLLARVSELLPRSVQR